MDSGEAKEPSLGEGPVVGAIVNEVKRIYSISQSYSVGGSSDGCGLSLSGLQ